MIGADVVGAYLLAALGGYPTYGRLHISVQPEHWAKYKDPVTQIERALYGLHRSNYDWDTLAGQKLTSLGWVKTDDGEGSTWQRAAYILVMFVDGLAIGGPDYDTAHAYLVEIHESGIQLEIGESHIAKYMGMNISTTSRSHGILSLRIEQENYARQLLVRFKEDSGLPTNIPLKKAYAPGYEEKNQLIIEATGKTGKFASTCRKHIGGLWYLARCTRGDIFYYVWRLARDCDKWDAASDLKLHRLFQYLEAFPDVGLTMCFDTNRVATNTLEVWTFTDSDHGDILLTD